MAAPHMPQPSMMNMGLGFFSLKTRRDIRKSASFTGLMALRGPGEEAPHSAVNISERPADAMRAVMAGLKKESTPCMTERVRYL